MTIKNRNPLNLVELLIEKQNKTTERQLFLLCHVAAVYLCQEIVYAPLVS